MTRKALLTLRVDPAELDSLDRLAAVDGVTRSEMFRRAIDVGMAAMMQDRVEDEIAASMKDD